MKNIVLIITMIVFIVSCNASKKIEQPQSNDIEFCESMTYNASPVNKISSDYYSIDTVFITNNCLNIWVSYSGGCGDAEFKLFFSDRIKESNPPKTALRLQLIDDDPCRAIVQQKLYYNLNFFDNTALNNGVIFELAGTNKKVLYRNN